MKSMRILCNPYEKTIQYFWLNEQDNTYVDMNEMPNISAELTRTKFTKNVTIQSRADEIVKIIDDLDPDDSGIDVHFIGTQDDFDDLQRVVEVFYASKNIHCIKEDVFFHPAEYSVAQIKEKFDICETVLREYQENEISTLLDSYEETIKPELAICVMGLYSSGKSAFINSLVGEELLPSASDPTTAKVCKISCRDCYSIRFMLDTKPCVVQFTASEKPSVDFDDSAFTERIQSICEGETPVEQMYHLLKQLNNSTPFSGYEDGELIEITLPYQNTTLPTNRFDFVIFDTPGSNSASNEKHFDVLNDALTAQTNALPIILTIPDQMDSTDNDKLLELIHGNETKLDTTNGLIIVNKSDEKMNKALTAKRDKIDSLKLTKWKSTRIFFVSALLGLASKKNDPHDENSWADEDMFELFEEKCGRYEANERQLYTYNIIDRSRKIDETLLPHENDNITKLLLFNSGLASVEFEIANYAKRYSQYLKCREAIKYLGKAIVICKERISALKAEQNQELDKEVSRFDTKKQKLIYDMRKEKEHVVVKSIEQFPEQMETLLVKFKTAHSIYTGTVTKLKSDIYQEFHEKWKQFTKESAAVEEADKTALARMQAYVTRRFNSLLDDLANLVDREIDARLETRVEVFKRICQQIIMGSDAVNDEQKQILDSIVMNASKIKREKVDFDLRGIRLTFFGFLMFGKENYNNLKCCDSFLSTFDHLTHERIDETWKENCERYAEWCEKMIDNITSQLCLFNSNLHELETKIGALKEQIETEKSHIALLKETNEEIQKLLGIQGLCVPPQTEEEA